MTVINSLVSSGTHSHDAVIAEGSNAVSDADRNLSDRLVDVREVRTLVEAKHLMQGISTLTA
jgi:hypothetical protein